MLSRSTIGGWGRVFLIPVAVFIAVAGMLAVLSHQFLDLQRTVRRSEELKADVAVIDAGAKGQVVAVAEQLVAVGGLHRGAEGRRSGPGAVQRAVGRVCLKRKGLAGWPEARHIPIAAGARDAAQDGGGAWLT